MIRTRSLGAELVLLLTGAGVIAAVAILLLLAAIITPSFDRLEADAVRHQVERTDAMLADRLATVAHLATTVRAGDAIGGGIAWRTAEGRVAAAEWTGEDGTRDPAMAARWARRAARLDGERGGFVRIGDRIVAVGRGPAGSGSGAGTVLVARLVGSAELTAALGLGAYIGPASGETVTLAPAGDAIRIAVPLIGPDGHAVATARIGLPREAAALGRRMLLFAGAGSTILLLLLLSVLRRAIARRVLAPLARIERHMEAVRASGALTPLADDGRPDEIGALGRSFNAMLGQLRELRERIEAQSFALGRSESAVAVMHNVRNALNPVSTILSREAARPGVIDRATIDRALSELAADDLPAARRQKLVAFVAAAIEAEAGAAKAWRHELAAGHEAMAQVLEILGAQQEPAHDRPQPERCDVTALVARNAAIARYSQSVSIAFRFPAEPWAVTADRLILGQLIGNLFANAAEAIAATGAEGGTIAVAIAAAGDRVSVSIRDTGEGFAPDRQATLFQRGFSTRSHRSGGLGLHWCANAATAMGGALELRSAGPGLGAEAILLLPAAPALARAA